MARSYPKILFSRAARQAWRAVIAHSRQALVTKLASTGLLLALAYAYVHRTTSGTDDQLFSDQATIVGLAAAAAVILVFGVFVVQLLFVAPYQLWQEEKERADHAVVTSGQAYGPDRAAFDKAMLALRHVANARELWFVDSNRRGGKSAIGNRVVEAIDEIRRCFPPGAARTPSEDQITRLYDATISFGWTLGVARSDTPQLQRDRQKFEREFEATVEHFDLKWQDVATNGQSADKALRRRLIASGRDLVHRYRSASPNVSFDEYARERRDFYDLQPHLGDEYQQWVARNADRAKDASGDDPIGDAMFLRELARLEQEWKLI